MTRLTADINKSSTARRHYSNSESLNIVLENRVTIKCINRIPGGWLNKA